jgi:hypothetical protein
VRPRPDPNRLGGLAWTRRTHGRLTRTERRRLLGAVAAAQLENAAGRLRLALARRNPRAGEVDVASFMPPDSRLAREAEAACEEQPPSIAAHSYRTWMYGLALAAVDRIELDRELFYCAALVHDYGIAPPVAGRDFTCSGVPIARCGALLRPDWQTATASRSQIRSASTPLRE